MTAASCMKQGLILEQNVRFLIILDAVWTSMAKGQHTRAWKLKGGYFENITSISPKRSGHIALSMHHYQSAACRHAGLACNHAGSKQHSQGWPVMAEKAAVWGVKSESMRMGS